mgnify:CR=1 FL=1
MFDFSDEQVERYSRHIILPEVGGEGQSVLLGSKVLLVGAGGLGSPAAYYLAAAGIGNMGIIDFDTVDLSNLQRQIIHNTERIGMLKTESAKKTIEALNPDVKVTVFNEKLTSENIMRLFEGYDYILDGTDNFATRYLINDACVLTGKTNIHGSIFRFEGQVTVFKPKEGPCYRCLYPEPPPPGLVPNCQEGGVLGVLAGIIGNLQVVETLKLILGQGETLIGSLLLYDALKTEFRKLKLKRDPNCPICSDSPTITELIDYEEVKKLAKEHKPKLIIVGASAYPRIIDPVKFREIADEVGAKIMTDIAHPAGLVAAGLYPSPVPYSEFVTTTTHKTLRGPRGGMILCREEFAKEVNKKIFPGIQGGPLMHVIAAKAVAFKEALSNEFVAYQKQVIANAKHLANFLNTNGNKIVSGGTDTHLMLLDLREQDITGKVAEEALEKAGITVNKNTIPFETRSPFVTSGVRIGTPALTTRGMKEKEMEQIGGMIIETLKNIEDDAFHSQTRRKVRDLCDQFPLHLELTNK